MGKARKKKDVIQASSQGNFGLTARNIGVDKLAGVIFGCKHHTMKECHSKQLFGLPACHFSYVRYVRPGLPLFLFNYSDRNLHGVYEAVSQGQMYIDRHAWTEDGVGTPFPAQVKIRVRMPCHPLTEEQFGPVIETNYYKPRLFWFELDQSQTDSLLSLFVPLAVNRRIPRPLNARQEGAGGSQRQGTLRNEGGSQDLQRETSYGQSYTSVVTTPSQVQQGRTWSDLLKDKSLLHANNEAQPGKTWSDLLKGNSSSQTAEEVRNVTTSASENLNLQIEASFSTHGIEGDSLPVIEDDISSTWEDTLSSFKDEIFAPHHDGIYQLLQDCVDDWKKHPQDCGEEDGDDWEKYPQDCGEEDGDDWDNHQDSIIMTPDLHYPNQIPNTEKKNIYAEKDNCQIIGECSTDRCPPETAMVSKSEYASLCDVVNMLLRELDSLKLSQLLRDEKINSLEQQLDNMKKMKTKK